MSMKKMKKVLSFVLAVVMCVSLFTTFAFAGNTGDIDNDPVRPQTKYNIVCIGDEYANGRGLPGYGTSKSGAIDNNPDVGALDVCAPTSYVALLGDRIQYALGQGFDVKTTSLCFNGMRAQDLQAILEKTEGDYYTKQVVEVYNTWFDNNKSALNEGDGRLPDADWAKLSPIMQLAHADQKPYVDLQDYLVAKIKEASLITYDLGMNSFSTYLLNRLEAAIAWAKNSNNYMIDEETGESVLVFTEDYPYYGDDPEAIHGVLVPGSEKMLRLLVDNTLAEFSSIAPAGLVKELSDAFLYAFFDFCVGFNKDIAYIRFLAPLSQIIVVGTFNAVEDMRFAIDYPYGTAGQSLKVDLGGFWESYLGMAAAFVTNGQAGTQYKYAPLIDSMNNSITVETLYDEAVATAAAQKADKKVIDALPYEEIIVKEMLGIVAKELGISAEDAINLYYGYSKLASAFGKIAASAEEAAGVPEEEQSPEQKAAVAAMAAVKIAKTSGNSAVVALIKEMSSGNELQQTVASYLLSSILVEKIDILLYNINSSVLAQQVENAKGEVTASYDPYVISQDAISGDIRSRLMVAFEGKLPRDKETSFPTFELLATYTRLLAGTNSVEFFVNSNVDSGIIREAPIGTLPSADGHATKMTAILKAWITPGNADTTAEDISFGVASSFFGSFLNSFQVPILDAINDAFRTFVNWSANFFKDFFSSIRNGISTIFAR